MSALHPASSTTSTPATTARRRQNGNAADVHYLEEARDALGPIMAASRGIATSGRSHHVRGLARLALAEQTDQLAAITAALSTWVGWTSSVLRHHSPTRCPTWPARIRTKPSPTT